MPTFFYLWQRYLKYTLLAQNNRLFKTIILLLVVSFTFLLRAVHSDRVPGYGHLEEHLFGWSGIYLIEEGVPVSWSTLDYPKSRIVYSGPVYGAIGNAAVAYVDLVKPWLDEPPLFSLIIGGSAHLFGADRHQLIPSAYLRFPMLIISLFTSLTLFFLTRKLFGFWVGAGAVLIWGTVPLFVFGSRLAVPENVIALFYLLSLYLFLVFKKRQSPTLFLLLCVLPGVAGLMKPTGFFIAPLISFLFFQLKQWKQGGLVLLMTTPFIAGFLAYGFYLDPEVFPKILSIQGMRPTGWNGLAYLLANPAFDIFPFYDAWYLFAWVIALYFLLIPHKADGVSFLSLAFIYWVLIAVLSGGEHDLLPWYRFPFFPLLAIYLALGLRQVLVKPNFFSLALAVGFLPGNYSYLVNAFHPSISSALFRAQFSLLTLPGILYMLWQTKWFKQACRAAVVVSLLAGFIINILVVKNYYSRTCEAKVCPIGPGTFLTR